MLAGKRAMRVGEQIQKEVALLLLEKVKDPRVKNVTITGIQLSDDLKLAKIYFSVFGKDVNLSNAIKGLDSAKGYIKREIGVRLALRYVPDITFMHDLSLESGNRMDKLLKGLGSNGISDSEEHD
ncbi:30S ribosome-binding factor RbfA [Thermodesulfobacteriota bacterium]